MSLRKIIEIDEEKCDGCGLCIPSCHEGALAIVDGKARLVRDALCDGIGACLGECPLGALRVVEREAEAFDEEAVRAHREPAGCPSARLRSLPGGRSGPSLELPADSTEPSMLRNWPVQLALVPPTAPYLRGADLLIAADCTAFAFAGFHRQAIEGRILLIACPKLDDVQQHTRKLHAIFHHSPPAAITVAQMEVPCCWGIVEAARFAHRAAGLAAPLDLLTFSIDGSLKGTERLVPAGEAPVS